MIRVLIADDHELIRAGFKQYIREYPDITVADEAENGNEALDKALNCDYDVFLVDIAMPGMNGLDILKQLKNQKPDSKVLVVTVHPEEQYAMRAIKAGASGYLKKDCTQQEFITAIRKLASGGKYISPPFAEKLVFGFINNKKPLHEKLSDREYQVLYMIVRGKRLKDIAEELSLSIKTISSYRTRILEKMNVKSNVELARYAIDNHLIMPWERTNSIIKGNYKVE
jgi:DNA-binding NarL/FixJ family response regulator